MKATVIYNGQEIEVDFMGDTLKEMGFQINKVWEPQAGETYYYIDSYNQVKRTMSGCTRIDDTFYDYGNCYKTPEEAVYERDCQLYLMKYKRWLDEYNDPIDWTNGEQGKWFASYNCKLKRIYIDSSLYYIGCPNMCYHKNQGTLYATSQEIIEDFIKEIGEDNYIKFILRVKEV